MSISLYPHQIEAVENMKNGSILKGGVGSGKSRTALAYYFKKIIDGTLEVNGHGKYSKPTKPMNLYIITTARKRDTLEWEEEMIPFTLSTNPKISVCGINVTIDSWNNVKKYVDVKNSFFIFDEQRAIGYGVWARSFIKISKSNKWIMLSATPGDTWMDYIPVFIANGFYKNKTEFIRNHVVYNRFTKYPQVDKFINQGRLIRYRNDILIDMPYERGTIPINHTIVVDHDKMTEKYIMKKRWNPIEDKPIENASEYTHLLRKIVNMHPDRMKEILKLTKRHPRIIIFYTFNFELDILRESLSENDILFAEWNGHKHEPIPKAKKWVYLVQYTSGAEGWNCIETDTMIFYSLNHSYKIMQQAKGRIDRLNTPYKELHYYYIRSNSRVDFGIAKSLKEKKDFNMIEFYRGK